MSCNHCRWGQPPRLNIEGKDKKKKIPAPTRNTEGGKVRSWGSVVGKKEKIYPVRKLVTPPIRSMTRGWSLSRGKKGKDTCGGKPKKERMSPVNKERERTFLHSLRRKKLCSRSSKRLEKCVESFSPNQCLREGTEVTLKGRGLERRGP